MKIQVGIKIESINFHDFSGHSDSVFFWFNFLILFTQNTEPNPRPGRTDRSGCPKSAACGAPTTGGMGNCGRCEFLVHGWWMN